MKPKLEVDEDYKMTQEAETINEDGVWMDMEPKEEIASDNDVNTREEDAGDPVNSNSVSGNKHARQDEELANQVSVGASHLKRRRVDHAEAAAGPSSANTNRNSNSVDSTRLAKTQGRMQSPEPELRMVVSSFEQSSENTRSGTRSIPHHPRTSLKGIIHLIVDLKSKDFRILIPLKPEDHRKNVTWLRNEAEFRFRYMGELGDGESIKFLTTKDNAVLRDEDILEDLIDETNGEMVAVI